MLKLTKEHIKAILNRMEKDGASYIDIDVEIKVEPFDVSWSKDIFVDEYSEDGRLVGGIRIYPEE